MVLCKTLLYKTVLRHCWTILTEIINYLNIITQQLHHYCLRKKHICNKPCCWYYSHSLHQLQQYFIHEDVWSLAWLKHVNYLLHIRTRPAADRVWCTANRSCWRGETQSFLEIRMQCSSSDWETSHPPIQTVQEMSNDHHLISSFLLQQVTVGAVGS